ncbi:MAG: HEAT repeat domain-containing protein, partial [Sedimentisphaerales bacterium]|nr:HEAT repeat domain-containing protein [Sedimentisphaerales bacterium]
AKAAIGKLLNDDSWSVRIAAANAMCDWGEQEKGLPVLVEAIGNSQASTRHFAMVAMEKIGNKARPALAAIKARLKDGYAGRVAKRIVGKL